MVKLHIHVDWSLKTLETLPVPTLLRGYAEVELLSISELNEFIITAQPQEIKFVCTGGATYPVLGAQRNSKELCRPLLAYRVEMSNADDTNE
ncbi:hypothetical protein HID58_001600, partial [Brassica napus]